MRRTTSQAGWKQEGWLVKSLEGLTFFAPRQNNLRPSETFYESGDRPTLEKLYAQSMRLPWDVGDLGSSAALSNSLPPVWTRNTIPDLGTPQGHDWKPTSLPHTFCFQQTSVFQQKHFVKKSPPGANTFHCAPESSYTGEGISTPSLGAQDNLSLSVHSEA